MSRIEGKNTQPENVYFLGLKPKPSVGLQVRHINVTAKDSAFIQIKAYSEQYTLPSALADGYSSIFLIRPRKKLMQNTNLFSAER
jgi:hypothetical protein